MADNSDNKPQVDKAQATPTSTATNNSANGVAKANDAAPKATPTDVKSQSEPAQASAKAEKTSTKAKSSAEAPDDSAARKPIASRDYDNGPDVRREDVDRYERTEGYARPQEDERRASRWRNDDRDQRNLFNDDDYDRRPQAREDDRDQRGRWASQGYGHTRPHDLDEQLNREYGRDYRQYSNQTRDEDRARYGQSYDRDRQGWSQSGAPDRDRYAEDRNARPWASQGSQDRHRDWDRDDQGRYSNARSSDYRDRDYEQGRRRDDDRWRGHYGADERERHYQGRGYPDYDARDRRDYDDRSRQSYAHADDRSFARGRVNDQFRMDDRRNYEGTASRQADDRGPDYRGNDRDWQPRGPRRYDR